MAFNPVKLTSLQVEPSMDDDWRMALSKIMQLESGQSASFASQPFANRLDAILAAVVPARPNPTHAKVLAIVNALAENGAIRKEEVAGVYDALLSRVAKFNSLNVQNNLKTLIGDVREAVAQKVRHEQANIGSLTALNSFLATQPATVPRGQHDYTGFINALRLLVTEAVNTEVYRAGPEFFLQSSRNGSQTVNLSAAFKNLYGLWGVKAPTQEKLAVSSLLTPNTRLLLLLVSPFTDLQSVSSDSYLGYLLTLYREALGGVNVVNETQEEIKAVSEALGQEPSNVESTLNYLLTNRVDRRPTEHVLSPEQERVLRYLQQAVNIQITHNHRTPMEALDAVMATVDTTYYARHKAFIMRLIDFLRRALNASRTYFFDAIMNPRWLPPEGFYANAVDFPALGTVEENVADVPVGAAAEGSYDKSNIGKEVATLSKRLQRSWSFKPETVVRPKVQYRSGAKEDSDEELGAVSLDIGRERRRGMFDHLKPRGGKSGRFK